MEAKVNFLISATFIKIRTSFALMRALSQPNQTKLATIILTFWCASHRDAPKADFICKTRETHNICVLPTKNDNFRDKFPPEAAGKRKGLIFDDGFPPEGAHLLTANVCRDKFSPEVARQSNGSSFSHIRPYTYVYPIAYCIAYPTALVLLNLFRHPTYVGWMARLGWLSSYA